MVHLSWMAARERRASPSLGLGTGAMPKSLPLWLLEVCTPFLAVVMMEVMQILLLILIPEFQSVTALAI